MDEVYDRAAMVLGTAAMPYTVFANPAVKDLLMRLGDLRQMSNRQTLELCIQKMSSNYKMANCVANIEQRFKTVT